MGGQLQPFIFYNPYEGSPVGSNYDSTGVNTTGRYICAFRNNWQQSTGMLRTDASNFELIQLPDMDANYANLAGFGPHGKIVGATIFVLSSHVPGSPNTAGCFAQNPALYPIGVLSPRYWLYPNGADGSTWTKRLDSASIAPSQLLSLEMAFGSAPPNGTDTVSDQLLIYDCHVSVTYADGANGTLRATAATFDDSLADPSSPGTVANANYAIDGDTSTAASISANAWGTVYFSQILILSNFQ